MGIGLNRTDSLNPFALLKAVLPYESSLSVEHTKQVFSRKGQEVGFEHTSARDASDLGMSTWTAMVPGQFRINDPGMVCVWKVCAKRWKNGRVTGVLLVSVRLRNCKSGGRRSCWRVLNERVEAILYRTVSSCILPTFTILPTAHRLSALTYASAKLCVHVNDIFKVHPSRGSTEKAAWNKVVSRSSRAQC